MWQDMIRQCKKFNLDWQQPSEFPRSSLLAARVCTLALDYDWGREFCKSVYKANFCPRLEYC